MTFFTDEFLDFVKREVKDAVEQAFVVREERKNIKLLEQARYLTRHQVSTYLGIAPSTVDYWSRIGKLTKVYIGKTPRFIREDIDKVFTRLKRMNKAA